MPDYWRLVLVFSAGLALGGGFFGGLWWTVRMGMASKQPALLFLASLLVRNGLVLAGFYWLSEDNWLRLVICLFGFVCARFLVARLTEPLILAFLYQKYGDTHAP